MHTLYKDRQIFQEEAPVGAAPSVAAGPVGRLLRMGFCNGVDSGVVSGVISGLSNWKAGGLVGGTVGSRLASVSSVRMRRCSWTM